MSLDIMNFSNLAMVSLLFVASLTGQDYDHETLSTNTGRVYREIFILGADSHGLTFRHAAGIAKVPFGSLSESYRMLYEPVADLEDAPETERELKGEEEKAEVVHAGDLELPVPADLMARSQITLRLPAEIWRLGGGLSPCWVDPAGPSWWPQHQRVHRLSHPLYREMAVRDFLHSSGLLPVPCRR